MNYFIGIDGGGTKTHCIITDNNLSVLYECKGGPSNFLMLGTETVAKTILDLIIECTEKLSISTSDVTSIVLGTTGAGRRNDAESLEKAFLKLAESKNIIINNFRVESDARIALEGAFLGRPGCILISGTGSIMFGKDLKGKIHRVGGFGRFIGDEGSGYRIGREGLRTVAKNFDGRGKETLLSKFLKDNYSIESPESLITEIYKNNFDIASFATSVLEAAELGDSISKDILEKESDELVLHIKAMYKLLNEEIMHTAFIGSLISNENYYSSLLKNKIKQNLPNIRVKKPDESPTIGAVLMAQTLKNN